MSGFFKAACAVTLIGAGGFLVYRGIHEYWRSEQAQRHFADRWKPAPMERAPRPMPRFIPEGSPFSRLEIPRLRTALYVVEGDDAQALKKGPGHVRGSAMPGDDGNCVIAGHRDMHFRVLQHIQQGDRVFLETAQGRFCYRVTGMEIVRPTETRVLRPTRDAELHLITCYPFYFLGHAPKRFVVTAQLERGEGQPAAANALSLPAASPAPAVRPASPRKLAARPRVPVNNERSIEATRALNRAAAEAGG